MRNSTMVLRLWFHTWLILNAGVLAWLLLFYMDNIFLMVPFAFISPFAGLPALIVYLIAFPRINKAHIGNAKKMQFLFTLSAVIALAYGIGMTLLAALVDGVFKWDLLPFCLTGSLILCAAGALAILINRSKLYTDSFIIYDTDNHHLNPTNTTIMEHYSASTNAANTNNSNGNKPLFKGLITAGLILLLLIPTAFISNLVAERQLRQQEVVRDVTGKWAGQQTVTFPYLYIPYYHKDSVNKNKPATRYLLVLPDNLEVNGTIVPEQRLRSIYKVLLYRTSIASKGNFVCHLPKEVDISSLVLSEAKICVGISDFKGIEKKIDVSLHDKIYTLSPGLPTNAIDSEGLSAPVDLTQQDMTAPISFDMPLSLKGSAQLHFVPLSGNSQFSIQSSWADPSFDGNTIPNERKITDAGFTAKWAFNKANLPFGSILNDEGVKKELFAFGVTMVQPADQYAKTTRSVKYAILFIGLTFSLFFIIELLQKKPVHPVQYVLVGLALIIFYSLLLAISEFVLFDIAYLIASLATILLITLYAKAHFNKWSTAAIFAGSLSVLYTFIFILIRLEDTALLVGSIGLFIMLAGAMYASRRINWYHVPVTEPA